jgi:hypothetical protein
MGTCRAQPSRGHLDMTIGLNQFRDPSKLTLLGMLILPFIGKQGAYAIGRRGTEANSKTTLSSYFPKTFHRGS